MGDRIYRVEHLEHSYGEHTVLRIDSLFIRRGTIAGLIGPNGSGKSTLLRLLAFVEDPSHGRILFNGSSEKPFSHAVRHRVTLLTQEPYLLRRSVFQNLFYGLKIRKDTQNSRQRVHEALSWVGLSPPDFERRQWYELSGGEAQRVALASRLILKPQVLLLDEPTANVDAASAHLIKEASLRARQEWGTTLVIASHDWNWLHEVCDEIVHLFKGQIAGSGVENILFGPWRQSSETHWEKRLRSGQRIRVSAPPRDDMAAVVDPTVVSVTSSEPGDAGGDNVLFGTLSRLSLEKASGDVLATVAVDDLTFTVRLSQSRIRGGPPLYPGGKVWMTFDSRSVKWI